MAAKTKTKGKVRPKGQKGKPKAKMEGLDVSVSAGPFGDALVAVSKAVGGRTRPVLQNVRVKVAKTMTVSATDMDLAITARVMDSEAEFKAPGETLVPHGKLMALTKKFNKGQVIDVSAKKMVGADSDAPVYLAVENGSSEKYEFATDDVADFPALIVPKDGWKCTIERGALELLCALRACANTASATYANTGVELAVLKRGKKTFLRASATDGVVGAQQEVQVVPAKGVKAPDVVTVPVTFLAALSSLKGDDAAMLGIGAKKVTVRSENVQVTTHTLDGDFPKLTEIIDGMGATIGFKFLTSDVEPLVKRAQGMTMKYDDQSSTPGGTVVLTIGAHEWQLSLKAQTHRSQSALFCEMDKKGALAEYMDGKKIGVNSRLLLTLFNLSGDHATIRLPQKKGFERESFLVDGDTDGFRSIMMPVTFAENDGK